MPGGTPGLHAQALLAVPPKRGPGVPLPPCPRFGGRAIPRYTSGGAPSASSLACDTWRMAMWCQPYHYQDDCRSRKGNTHLASPEGQASSSNAPLKSAPVRRMTLYQQRGVFLVLIGLLFLAGCRGTATPPLRLARFPNFPCLSPPTQRGLRPGRMATSG